MREVVIVIEWRVVIIKRRQPWKSNLVKGANRLRLMLNHMTQFPFLQRPPSRRFSYGANALYLILKSTVGLTSLLGHNRLYNTRFDQTCLTNYLVTHGMDCGYEEYVDLALALLRNDSVVAKQLRGICSFPHHSPNS